MKPARRSLLPIAFIAALAFPVAAQAQLFRAYVASSGSDANPCTLPAPCRLLPAALAAVANGGEIWMLDSANYNTSTVTVGKSVTLLAIPGAVGSVLAIGGNAMNVNTPGVELNLRNVVIVPSPAETSVNGVVMNQGAALTIDACTIAGIPQKGVVVNTAALVRITNTVFRGNYVGASINAGAHADISASKFFLRSGGYGVEVYGADPGPTLVAISDSIVTGGESGISGWDYSATSKTRVSVTRSTISNNHFGVSATSFAGGSVLVSVGGNMVTGNGVGLSQINAGSAVESLGNNMVRQNTVNSQGVITPVSSM